MKKGFAALLIGALFMPSSAFAASPSAEMPFDDVIKENTSFQAIEYLKQQGIIKGYDDKTFKPDNTINRAEFLKIVVGSIMKDPQGKDCFVDVKDEWFAKYVCAAKEKKIIEGYSDGTFKPGQNINFAEASKIVAKSFALKEGENSKNDPWFRKYVQPLEEKMAIPVSIDYPEKKMTRSEMAEMAWRLKLNIASKPSKKFNDLIAAVPAINSCAELKEKFAGNYYRQNRVRYVKGGPVMLMNTGAADDAMQEGAVTAQPATAPQAAATKEAAGFGGGGEQDSYSTTNVQVQGVDEADIIKNDGKYVYMIKGKTIRIVDVNPPDSMKEQSTVTIKEEGYFSPSQLYVTAERLVVIGTQSDAGKTHTNAYIFDITDRKNPVQKRRVSFDGNYISSRRIGDKVYFVMNDYPSFFDAVPKDPQLLIPQMSDSKEGKTEPMVGCTDIRFFPHYSQPQYLITAALPLEDAQEKIIKQVYMGAGDNVYSSLENLYIATTKSEYDESRVYDFWSAPSGKTSTVIYQFALNNGEMEYKGKGEVPGTVLNQFSMDENGDAFRIATTEDHWTLKGENDRKNQLYLLNRANLSETLGKVENIAPGESIKSARFMGDRAYIVTFKNVDPLFVIDVKDPKNPKVLGELKIPGYSDYLHPYDENHLIGFGKEVDESIDADKVHSANSVYYTAILGMKVALFDVTDVANPKEQFKEVIGWRGTESELLQNHKALLFSKEKNLIAFPITVVEPKGDADSKVYDEGKVAFRGAYVYSLDLEKGFQLKAKLTHFEEGDKGATDRYYYGGANTAAISRLLFMGQNLYSVSMAKIQGNSLTDFTKKGEVKLTPEKEEEVPVMY